MEPRADEEGFALLGIWATDPLYQERRLPLTLN